MTRRLLGLARRDRPNIVGTAQAGFHELPRRYKVLIWVQAVALPGYAILLFLPSSDLLASNHLIMDVITLTLPAALCLARARGVGANRRGGIGPARTDVDRAAARKNQAIRRGYALLGAGCLSFCLGDVVFGLLSAIQVSVPDPSWADIPYLAVYPLFAAGLIILARAELGQRLPGGIWLDGLTGVLGVATLGSALGLRIILSRLAGAPVTLITEAAYPICDVLLISMVVGVVALRGGRPGPIWWWLGGGLTVFALGDTIYMWRASTGIYTDGTPLDAVWALGLTLIAVAAICRPPVAPRTQVNGRAAIVLPVGASVAAIAILIAGNFVSIPWYSVALAAFTLLAALGRTVAAFRTTRLLAESRAQARTDDLTGLGNRRAFYEFAQDAVQRAGESGPLSVLLLDLDRFKEINDSLGHHIGDQLLRQVSDRLTHALRPADYLARLGGDEFVIVLPHDTSTQALAVAARLTQILAEPFTLDALNLQVSASIGVAAHPEHARDVSGLLQCADVAMYQAKATHVGASVYDAARDEPARDRFSTVEQLRYALNNDQLVLHYQPQCDVRTGAVLGVEALVRWQHPERGLIYPDDFLPLVEQTGLMPALTLHVLDRAVAQCGQWLLAGRDLTMSVNLSTSNLLDERLPAQVAEILARHGLPAAALLLEVTENTLMVDPDRATATLTALHELGVGLSIDDYGTGYCSLAYLRDLPVDELKLDKSFLLAAVPGSRASAIVRSTIDLAHSLGLRMVAEGVETAPALELLQNNNCDIAQGYFLTQALPADDLTHWLSSRPVPDIDAFDVTDLLDAS